MYPKAKMRSSWGVESAKEEDSIYSRKTREKLVEEGALTNEEAGFMEGYEELFEESLAEDWME